MNFVYSPLKEKGATLDTEHILNTTQINLYNQQIRDIKTLKKNVEEKTAKLPSAQFSTSVNGNNVAEDVGKAFDTVGINITSIAVLDEKLSEGKTLVEKRNLYSVSLNIVVDCKKEDLLLLLNYFEKQTKGIYYVNNVNYKNEKGEEKTEITMTLYYFKQVE